MNDKRGRYGKKKGKKTKSQSIESKTRKELRKEKRKLKKAKKNEHFQRKKINKLNSGGDSVPEENSIDKKSVQTKNKKKQIVRSDKEKERKLQMEMKSQRIKLLRKANKEEDRVIKKLEKQLHLNKRKRKSIPKSFATDGLDYLLEVCEQNISEVAVVIDKTINDSDSEFEKDLALIRGEKQNSSAAGKTKSVNDEDISNSNISDADDDDDYDHNDDDDIDHSHNEDSDRSHNNDTDDGSNDDDVTSESVKNKANFISDSVSEVSENEGSKSLDIGTNYVNKKKNCRQTKECTESKVMKQSGKENRRIVDQSESENITKSSKSLKKNHKTKHNSNAQFVESDTEFANKGTVKLKRKLPKQDFDVKFGEYCENVEENESQQLKHNVKKKKQKLDPHHVKTDDIERSDDNIGFESESENSDCEHDSSGEEKQEEYWEDIYGRTRDRQGNVVQVQSKKYIPPHIRQDTSDDSSKKQEQQRLKKQLKGLLNRLAENNMKSIASQIEELYMSNSRNNMNETLTGLLHESLVAQVLTPERLIMEHAVLVAILHANVGTEVGAHILHVFVKKFIEYYEQKQEAEDKSLDNILLILCHLYNFKMFNAVLMYDILEKLSKNFDEKEVELILLVLKSVGFSLRKDDPMALKDLILKLQKKAGEAVHLQNNTRVKFMLDILLAIKNNNMGKIPHYDPSHSEHLKKLVKGFLHKGNYVTELKISLDDLLRADERGRWWVVGSAWSGPLPGNTGKQDVGTSKPQQSNYSQQLLELARKQRMNTDVRRNIFCILMTAEDFLDGFEKLLHLGLKNQQEREIIHVVIHCCLQEKQFNPYYCHLAQKFCDFDRKYQIIIQCALWDKFKELKNMMSLQVTNLAKFLVHLVIEKGLPLSVLKVIHFAEVDQITVRFLRQVLLGILLNESEESVQQVFQRVSVSSKLHIFREGIRLFIHHFLLRNLSHSSMEDTQILQSRAKMADKILCAAESKVKF